MNFQLLLISLGLGNKGNLTNFSLSLRTSLFTCTMQQLSTDKKQPGDYFSFNSCPYEIIRQ